MAPSATIARFILSAVLLAGIPAVGPARAGGCACDKLGAEAFASPTPSFDCKLARSQSEHAICADETLARLDAQLNLAYLKALGALPGGARMKLYTEELSWVRKRDLTCSMKDSFGLRRCLAEMTIARIAEIAHTGGNAAARSTP